MTTWHRYPQHRDSHEERPWWRRDGFSNTSWQRTDGIEVSSLPMGGACSITADRCEPPSDYPRVQAVRSRESMDEALARIDREHPLPPPPPLAGQVWCWPDGPYELVTEIRPMTGALPGRPPPTWSVVTHNSEELELCIGSVTHVDAWPPPGAVLVYGPMSPWMDTREETKP